MITSLNRRLHEQGGVESDFVSKTRRKALRQLRQGRPNILRHLDSVRAGLLIDRNQSRRLALIAGAQRVTLRTECCVADIFHSYDRRAVVLGAQDHVVELRCLGDGIGGDRKGLFDRVRRRRIADAAHRELLILLRDGVGDVAGIDAQLRHAVGLEPDPHCILGHAENRRLVSAIDPVDGAENLHVGIVGDEVGVVPSIGREEREYHEERGGLLLHVDALRLDCLGKLRHRLVHPILHIHLCKRGIGVEREVNCERVVTGRGTGRRHVNHVVGAVHLLFDRCADVLCDKRAVCAWIVGRHLNLDGRDLGILRDRQLDHRDQAGDGDDQRNHRREDGAVDEKVGEHEWSPLISSSRLARACYPGAPTLQPPR